MQWAYESTFVDPASPMQSALLQCGLYLQALVTWYYQYAWPYLPNTPFISRPRSNTLAFMKLWLIPSTTVTSSYFTRLESMCVLLFKLQLFICIFFPPEGDLDSVPTRHRVLSKELQSAEPKSVGNFRTSRFWWYFILEVEQDPSGLSVSPLVSEFGISYCGLHWALSLCFRCLWSLSYHLTA